MFRDFYIFPCVFAHKENGDIGVYFPDLDGCTTFGKDEYEAYNNAKAALCLHIYGMEEDNCEIPVPSKTKDLMYDSDHSVILVEVFMPPYRARQKNKYIKKTLTIPYWLNLEAEKAGVNFSQFLQNSLKDFLHINR